MTGLGVLSAVFFALLPIVVVLVLRSRAGRPAWWAAVDIPAAIAIDLVATVVVSRFVFLDNAVWIVKGAWVAVGGAIILYRRSRGWRPSWPTELPMAAVGQALLLGLIALVLSLMMTRPCAIWDRQWHVPSLTSMRGQAAPFFTVYEPWKTLHYHWGGNLMAASLQASSFAILHASHALSLVHDICAFWFGITLTLLLRKLGLKHTTLLVLALLVMLFASPVVPLIGEHRTWFGGYSTTNWMSLSFRPHVPLAALTTVPFLAVPLVRLTELEQDIDWRALCFPLTICVPLMLIVDEFALGTLGLGLAVVWLLYPRVFGTSRLRGLYVFAGLGVGMAFGIAIMQGTISPGAPSYPLTLVVPRSPGFYVPAFGLNTAKGLRYFVADLLPILAVLIGGAWLLSRTRHPLLVGSLALYAVLTGVSVFFFSSLQYNGSGLQNHKFIIGLLLFCPLFFVAWLIPRPGMHLRYVGIPELGMTLAIFLSAASGLDWFGGIANSDCRTGDISLSFYETNCRTDVGARVGNEPTRPMYFDPEVEYLYLGCRPAYTIGPANSMDGHDIKAGKATLGIAALRELAHEPRFQALDADTTVVCSTEATSDRACRLLKKTPGACKPVGKLVEMCTMTRAQRDEVLK